MNKDRELAIIGKGKWGANYINTLSSDKFDFDLPDSNIKTRDYESLYPKKDEIAGVIVATPISTHFKIASDLLLHGFNVLIEKPITQTYGQALELLKLHESTPSTIAMAGHIQLYDPAYHTLVENLNLIGDIQEIEYQGLQSPSRTDATVLDDWGPHPIYIFLDLTAKKPTSMKAHKDQDETIRLEFDFDNVKAKAHIGWNYPERRRILKIEGDKGSLTLDGSTSQKRLFLTNKKGQEKNIKFDLSRTPLALEITEFIDCIKNNQEPKTPLSQGVEVVRIIQDLSATI